MTGKALIRMPMDNDDDDSDKVYELTEQLKALKEALSDRDVFPPEWKLTGTEVKALHVLLRKKLASKEDIHIAMGAQDHADQTEIKIVDVYICKLRKKLEPFNVTIDTLWGQGYFLSPESRTLIESAMTLMRAEKTKPTDDSINPKGSSFKGESTLKQGLRALDTISLPVKYKPNELVSDRPNILMIKLSCMLIESSYQRELVSTKSRRLIAKIVSGWDWSKFKLPVVEEIEKDIYVIIDGQHTCIGATAHPQLEALPCIVVPPSSLKGRARAFISHNTDRIAMSPLQVFRAEVAAEDINAVVLDQIIQSAGATVPGYAPPKGKAKPGQVVNVGRLRSILAVDGDGMVSRILRIAVRSKVSPIGVSVILGLRYLLKHPDYIKTANLPEGDLAVAVARIDNSAIPNPGEVARKAAVTFGCKPDEAFAKLLQQRIDQSIRARADSEETV